VRYFLCSPHSQDVTMQNLPLLEIASSAFCLLAYIKYAPQLRSFGAKLQQAVEPMDGDYLNWTTRDGAMYEDIETFFVQGDSVTFRHKFGTARVAISTLTDSSRAQMISRYQENYSLSILPMDKNTREVGVFHSEAA
jgi:hypothetical protein